MIMYSAATDLGINPLDNGRRGHFHLSLSMSTILFMTFTAKEPNSAIIITSRSRGSLNCTPAKAMVPRITGRNNIVSAACCKEINPITLFLNETSVGAVAK